MKWKTSLAGAAAGWAAGLVYAIGSRGVGVLDVFNRDLEKAFGVSMGTVYKLEWAIKRLLGLCFGL